MTLPELERWFALQVHVYHSTIHSSLKITPLAAWKQAVAARETPIRQMSKRINTRSSSICCQGATQDSQRWHTLFNIHYCTTFSVRWRPHERNLACQIRSRDLPQSTTRMSKETTGQFPIAILVPRNLSLGTSCSGIGPAWPRVDIPSMRRTSSPPCFNSVTSSVQPWTRHTRWRVLNEKTRSAFATNSR